MAHVYDLLVVESELIGVAGVRLIVPTRLPATAHFAGALDAEPDRRLVVALTDERATSIASVPGTGATADATETGTTHILSWPATDFRTGGTCLPDQTDHATSGIRCL